jgi:hypothetical protein
MFQRHFAGKLSKVLKHADKNHLAKVLFSSSSRSMGADHFCDKRIERPNERAGRVVIMRARIFDQRAQIRFVHVASTPWLMTAVLGKWLHGFSLASLQRSTSCKIDN